MNNLSQDWFQRDSFERTLNAQAITLSLTHDPTRMIKLPECPICGKTVPPATDASAGYAPFCSRRCKEVDLIRWCEGRYSIVEAVDSNRLAETSNEVVESEFDDSSDQGMQGEYEDRDD